MNLKSPIGIPCLYCHAKVDFLCTNYDGSVMFMPHQRRLNDYNHMIMLAKALKEIDEERQN